MTCRFKCHFWLYPGCTSMTSTVAAAVALVMVTCLPLVAAAQDTMIYLARHGEKQATATDPGLTAEGQLRAQNIATTLKRANIRHIFSTAYARTQQTAQPLGTALALPVQAYDPKQQAAFAKQLLALKGNTLVVGHSNTIPELVRLLGGDPGADLPETEFNRLYQLAIGKDGSVTTTLLNSLP